MCVPRPVQGMEMIDDEPNILQFLCINIQFINPVFISVFGRSPEKFRTLRKVIFDDQSLQ